MDGPANVRSIEAIRDFKAAMLQFAETATNAITTLQQEVMHFTEWLEHDRPSYWKNRVRDSYDTISQARVALENCKMREVAGNRPACIEEQEALAHAKRDLQQAQEKVETVRRWTINVRHEADEYRGRIGQLERYLESDLLKSIALLDRILTSLEDYASVSTSEGDAAEMITENSADENSADESPANSTKQGN